VPGALADAARTVIRAAFWVIPTPINHY